MGAVRVRVAGGVAGPSEQACDLLIELGTFSAAASCCYHSSSTFDLSLFFSKT